MRTDTPQPYTLEELAARSDCPHRYAYPTTEAYLEGWYLWRALRRDGRPTEAERKILWAGLEERIRKACEAARQRGKW